MLGACAALLAWGIRTLIVKSLGLEGQPYPLALVDGSVVGLFTGATIAGFEKYNNTSRVGPTLLGVVIGLFVGLIGGILGLLIGEFLFQTVPVPEDLKKVMLVIGWGIFGVGVGVGPGIATGSLLKSLASSAGGCLGGIIGGGIFILLLSLFSRYVMTGSAVGFTLLGLFVGLLIALAQEVAKQAELKIVSSGPNEGKRFLIDKKNVTIGSASGNDWVISNDPILAPRHIEIRQERGKFVVHSKVAQVPAIVNRQPVQQQSLNDGDRIRIGNTEIAFKARKA
jgi:hypothetical protein